MYRIKLKQIEKMLSQTSTLTQNYKKVLMARMEHGDLETALYLRFLMELSVRSRDALQITPDCVRGRNVRAACMKFQRTPYYLRPDGSLPVISKKTNRLQMYLSENRAAILRNHGRFIYIESENMQEKKKFLFYYMICVDIVCAETQNSKTEESNEKSRPDGRLEVI